MDISVKEITSVDKELTISAKREDLQSNFDAAYKRYKGQITMPGFRPGKVPLSIVKKRFGEEIEYEEINKWVQKKFESDVVPEYKPVGETEMIDLKWENDDLEVTFKIGVRPEVELKDLKKIKVNKMVHDVTDAEVSDELKRAQEKDGAWESVKKKITKEHKLIVDVISLDDKGNPIDGEKDVDQEIDLRGEGAKEFLSSLKGKSVGDEVDMSIGEGKEKDQFRVTIKEVQELKLAELNEEFIVRNSNEAAKTEDEFRSFMKSQMQQYYDQTATDLFKNEVVDALVDAHEFEVPEVFVEQVLTSYVEQLKQQQGNKLPENFDEAAYKEGMIERGNREAKWYFISQKLQETFEDIEIKPEDIDDFISVEAARFGATAEQLKGYYAQNPNMLEQLRSSIRENKVFEKLEDEVKVTELDKDKFQKLQDKKAKK